MNVDSKSSSTTRTVNAQNAILQKSVESLNRYSINSDFSFTRELQAAQNESSKKSNQAEKSDDEKQSDIEKKADVTSSATNEKDTKNIKSKDKVSSKSKTSETKKSETNEDKNKVSDNKEEESNNGEFAQVAGGVNYTDYKYGNKSQDLLSQNIKELYNTKDLINSNTNQNNSKLSSFQANSQFANTLDYSSINMSGEDAKFFVDLVNNTDKTMQGVTQELQSQMTSATENIQGSSRVSKALLDTIQEGMKTNQPFRINFGKDVSVVLQLDKNGVVSANFIPGDKAVEQYLKNNIGYLQQNFDSQDIPYNSLSYSEQKHQQQEQKNRKNNNKEND